MLLSLEAKVLLQTRGVRPEPGVGLSLTGYLPLAWRRAHIQCTVLYVARMGRAVLTCVYRVHIQSYLLHAEHLGRCCMERGCSCEPRHTIFMGAIAGPLVGW